MGSISQITQVPKIFIKIQHPLKYHFLSDILHIIYLKVKCKPQTKLATYIKDLVGGGWDLAGKT